MSNRQRDKRLIWPPGAYHAILADGQHVRISLAQEHGKPLPFGRIRWFTHNTGRDHAASMVDICRERARANLAQAHALRRAPGHGWNELRLVAEARRGIAYWKAEVVQSHRPPIVAGYYHDKTAETWTADPSFMPETCAKHWPAAKLVYRDKYSLPNNTAATYIASVPVAAPGKRRAVAKAEVVAFLRRVAAGDATAADAESMLQRMSA